MAALQRLRGGYFGGQQPSPTQQDPMQQRSREDAEELVRALEIVWDEQARLAKVYQAEAQDLWRLCAVHEKLIAELRSEVESLRSLLEAPSSNVSGLTSP